MTMTHNTPIRECLIPAAALTTFLRPLWGTATFAYLPIDGIGTVEHMAYLVDGVTRWLPLTLDHYGMLAPGVVDAETNTLLALPLYQMYQVGLLKEYYPAFVASLKGMHSTI